MSPDERVQFAQMLQQRAGGRLGGFRADDPRELARTTSRLRQGDGGGVDLGDLFGGSRGGGGGVGDLMSNPLAKAALGGIAAMAMKRMMGR